MSSPSASSLPLPGSVKVKQEKSQAQEVVKRSSPFRAINMKLKPVETEAMQLQANISKSSRSSSSQVKREDTTEEEKRQFQESDIYNKAPYS